MLKNNCCNSITKNLLCIKNQQFRYIGRAGNLAWLGFGEDVICKNYKGENRIKSRYALHIQCPFRITLREKKKLGSYDMYEPNSTINCSDDFKWNESGKNLYDEKASMITQELSLNDIRVVDVNSNEMGDLVIRLSNGWIIEAFTNSSSEMEEWRIFETGNLNKHFTVMTKNDGTVEVE